MKTNKSLAHFRIVLIAMLLMFCTQHIVALELTPAQMQKLKEVVVFDWLNAPASDQKWLDDTFAGERKSYKSSLRAINVAEINEIISNIENSGSIRFIDYKDLRRENWPADNHFNYLHKLVRAYATELSPLYMDSKLLGKIMLSLNFWLKNDFKNPNWWYQSIRMPAYQIGPMALVLEEHLTMEQKTKITEILARCELKNRKNWRTGGNLLFDCRAALMLGLFSNDTELVARMYSEKLPDGYKITPPQGSGIKEDFSHWEHGNLLFNHGYGAKLLVEGGQLLWYAKEAGISTDSSILPVMEGYLLKGCAVMSRNGILDYSARGRSVAGSQSSIKSLSYIEISGAYLMKCKTPSEMEIKNLIKKAIAKQVLFTGNKMFYVSDYMVHSTDKYYASVKMYSKRTLNTEICNSVNRLGFHLGEGNIYLFRNGDEYQDIFPVWDWNKIPGTTTNLYALSDAYIDENTDSGWFMSENPEDEGFGRGKLRVSRIGRTDFVGGVSTGIYGASVIDLKVLGLSAKKSYFFIGDSYVCMGAGISDKDSGEVVTTLEQSLLKTRVLTDNNFGRKLFYHDSTSYIVFGNTAADFTAKSQSGNMQRINANTSADNITKEVFSLWISHGRQPQNSTYTYWVVPGISYSDALAAEKNPDFEILSNTDKLQAIKVGKNGVILAIFHKAGILWDGNEKLVMSHPCTIIVNPEDKKIYVADPTWAEKKINFEYKTLMYHISPANGKTASVKMQLE